MNRKWHVLQFWSVFAEQCLKKVVAVSHRPAKQDCKRWTLRHPFSGNPKKIPVVLMTRGMVVGCLLRPMPAQSDHCRKGEIRMSIIFIWGKILFRWHWLCTFPSWYARDIDAVFCLSQAQPRCTHGLHQLAATRRFALSTDLSVSSVFWKSDSLSVKPLERPQYLDIYCPSPHVQASAPPHHHSCNLRIPKIANFIILFYYCRFCPLDMWVLCHLFVKMVLWQLSA